MLLLSFPKLCFTLSMYTKFYSLGFLTLQVSDFGLAKLALDANTHITTRVMGTFG